MNNAEFQLRGVGDPRLAVHATSAQPVWLWSIDGTRILWANPVGARLFGAANGAVLAERTFGPADPHRRQIALLAGKLPLNGTARLERLRGPGAALGTLSTCSCARLAFSDGSYGILVAAVEPVGRAMPLIERLQSLIEGIDTPIAAYASDGMFVGASVTARPLLGFRNLTEAGLDDARDDALKQGRVETPVGIGHMVLQRVGSGANIGLVALIASGAPLAAKPKPPAAAKEPLPVEEAASEISATPKATAESAVAETPPAETPVPDYEQPSLSGEAPAEFALLGETPAQPVPDAPEMHRTEPPAAESQIETPAVEAHNFEPDVSEPPQISAMETPRFEPAMDDLQGDSQNEIQGEIQHEPAPEVEAVADEPVSPPDAPAHAEEPPSPIETHRSAAIAIQPAVAPSWLDEPLPNARRTPLRFMWQMDSEGRFSLGSDEFTRLIGTRTAAGFGRLWSEIAEAFDLDPEGRVLKAIATRDTWSGVTLNWPVDGDGRLPVELSGLPIYDRTRQFVGYRGFGVCRDLDGLARLAALRRYEFFSAPPKPQALSSDIVSSMPVSGAIAAQPPVTDAPAAETPAASSEPSAPEAASSETMLPETLAPPEFQSLPSEISHPTNLETPVEPPKNVLPFRPLGDPKLPALTPVENNAFNELARQLSARLENRTETPAQEASDGTSEATDDVADLPVTPEHLADQTEEKPAEKTAEKPAEKPEWLARPEIPARGESGRDKLLLDLLPVGILIYRLDRLLYTNRSFLERMGYESLGALEEAGGLDALYVEPGVSSASSTSGTGTPVTISASTASGTHASSSATDAHLFTIDWDGDSAHALIFANAQTDHAAIAAALQETPVISAPSEATPATSEVGHANAEELGAILDTTAEGVVMFDAQGKINSCNRSAEALFGYDGADLVQRSLIELFALESQPAVMDYLQSTKGMDISSLLDHGRDLLGRVRGGGVIPLSITMGRTQADGPNFFAVFRDLSQAKKNETELQQARRSAERASNAKADMLARISHEVRTPLNAIIGFSEVMIGERFGSLGNERYVEYMKDIRASGERVLAIINDLLDLSRIETGKMDLAFADQNLNDLVESCVAVMQPQANRERIIIRTSLAHTLPPVIADARALRQITLNLIGNSIHLANAGGQVIVSTALSDFGEVVLRVRDTGHGLNDNEVAAAMEPFGTQAPHDQSSESSGVSLSLTKALVEANHAKFQIKTGPHSGTLIEVLFSHATARV